MVSTTAAGPAHRGFRMIRCIVLGFTLVCLVFSLPTAARSQTKIQIHVGNPDGSGMKQLTDLPEYASQGSPTFSQDGKWIAFDAWRSQKGERGSTSQIVIVDAEGKDPKVLIDGAMPSFSPQARRIAFSRYSPDRGVWIMSRKGPDEELLLIDERGWSIDWSPNGRKLAYATYGRGGANFVVVDIIEGDKTLLFDENDSPYKALHWNFIWSPDSKRIVFKGCRQDDSYEVGIVDARGAKHGLVSRVKEKVFERFAWHPDGRRIVFGKYVAEKKRHVTFFVDPDDDEAPQLLPGLQKGWHYYDVAYSADGKRLAAAMSRTK